MDKKIVKKILQHKSISMEELNSFIVDYIKLFKKIDVNAQQLRGISALISSGHFDLYTAAIYATQKLNMDVVLVRDINENIIKVDIFDLV